MGRTTNDAGIKLIQDSEGLVLHAYPDPGTGGQPWTVGYGHTGPDVSKNMTITEAEAVQLLRSDLGIAEKFVAHVAPIATDNQFAALVSFAFNVGRQNLQTSTLLKLHNQKDYTGAAHEFGKWTHAAGHVLPGLVTRRAAEAKLYATV